MTIMTYQVNNESDQGAKDVKKDNEVKKHPDKKKESQNSQKKRN